MLIIKVLKMPFLFINLVDLRNIEAETFLGLYYIL